jgi:hypothetical protein
MVEHALSRSAVLGDHQDPRRGGYLPLEAFPGDPWPEPHLFVVAAKCLFDRGELSLHLDYEQRSGRTVKGENVNRSALSEDRVGDLDLRIPAVPPERFDNGPDHQGMPFIECPVKVAATPADIEFASRVERSQDSSKLGERDGVEMPSLDGGDRRLRDIRTTRQVDLAPAASSAQCPDDQPDAPVFHPLILPDGAYPGHIHGLNARWLGDAEPAWRDVPSTASHVGSRADGPFGLLRKLPRTSTV